MAFSHQFLDELRTRVGLVDVVGKRVKLVRKGREHQGLCPFHNEKTPSFTVNEEKGFYHCFGCGAHGSSLDFVMETEGLSFPEAVEQLAGQAGMEVPRDTPEERERAKRRADLYDVMEAACAYFEKSLKMPEGQAGLAYLQGRGLTDDLIKTFRLGFAPDNRNALKAALLKQGIEEGQMVACGLLKRPDDAHRSGGPPTGGGPRGRDSFGYFKNRVMFPITDRRGKVIAFGARILGAGEPKYLNSPETDLFHKGRNLYGLVTAMRAVRDTGTVIVTEGYMDVIGLARAGMTNAVAPLGTALTEEQLLLLWKMTPDPVLCFDGDRAGQKAAVRAAERALPLLKAGLGVRFALMPEGEDPDSLVASGGKVAMQAVLDAALPLSEVLWRQESGGTLPASPEQRASVQKRLDEHVRAIKDPTVRNHFSQAFTERLWPGGAPDQRPRGGQKERGPRGQRGSWKKGRGWEPELGIGLSAADAERAQADRLRHGAQTMLAAVINHPSLFDLVEDRLGMVHFDDPVLDALRQAVVAEVSGHDGMDRAALVDALAGRGYLSAVDGLFQVDHIKAHRDIQVAAPFDAALAAWENNFDEWTREEMRRERERLYDQGQDGDELEMEQATRRIRNALAANDD